MNYLKIHKNKRFSESRKKGNKTAFNKQGYQILTPTGFQDFDGVSYNGLVQCLEFITENNKKILVSTKHKFNEEKLAKEYKIGDVLLTIDGIEKIIQINKFPGKRHVYDILDVKNGNVFLGNDIVNHNCHIIKDSNYAIIPEFNEELKKIIVKETDRAPFYDAYVGMDIGMKDLTVVLFGWYDFLKAKLIVEDEFVIHGQKFNTSTLADGIKQKEAEVFTDKITGEQRIPFLRISDNNLIVIKDLWDLHGLRFLPTRKDDADAALNKVRVMLENEQILINPRCKTLITHLEAGIWNKAKTSFDRSADNGHFDAIDSLKYLIRNVQISKNPYPKGYLDKYNESHFERPGYKNSQHHEFSKIFNTRKSSSESNKQLVDLLTPKKR